MSISDYVSIRHKYPSNQTDKHSVYRLRFSCSLNIGAVSQLNTVQNRYDDDVLQSRSLLSYFLSYDILSRDDYSIASI
jgi:hypothetical protein